MKVTTDACLFGAWCASLIQNSTFKIQHCLDIGTGTGLLSLMIAQKNNEIIIDAIEIDGQAANQSMSNFQVSSWKKILNVHHVSIQNFNQTNQLYDFIISNPPFFDNDLKSIDDKRNLALHSSELSLEELLQSIKINLKDDGKFAVLLPYHRTEYFEQLCLPENFFIKEKIFVKQTPHHSYFRTMLLFSKQSIATKQSEIIIKDKWNNYSNEFKKLMKDYYLHF